MVSTQDERYQQFLHRLRNARSRRGLTQQAVARLLNKPQSYVSRCESGERRLDIIEVAELAAVYRVLVGDLLPDERVIVGSERARKKTGGQ